MGLMSMWEHFSHAIMGFPAKLEQSAAAAELDAAPAHVWPYTHGNIPRADKEALLRRHICTRQDLSQFVNIDDIASALPDVSPNTQAQLCHGKQGTQLDIIGLKLFCTSCQGPLVSVRNSAVACREQWMLAQGCH